MESDNKRVTTVPVTEDGIMAIPTVVGAVTESTVVDPGTVITITSENIQTKVSKVSLNINSEIGLELNGKFSVKIVTANDNKGQKVVWNQ